MNPISLVSVKRRQYNCWLFAFAPYRKSVTHACNNYGRWWWWWWWYYWGAEGGPINKLSTFVNRRIKAIQICIHPYTELLSMWQPCVDELQNETIALDGKLVYLIDGNELKCIFNQNEDWWCIIFSQRTLFCFSIFFLFSFFWHMDLGKLDFQFVEWEGIAIVHKDHLNPFNIVEIAIKFSQWII